MSAERQAPWPFPTGGTKRQHPDVENFHAVGRNLLRDIEARGGLDRDALRRLTTCTLLLESLVQELRTLT